MVEPIKMEEEIKVEIDACNPQVVIVNGKKFVVSKTSIKKIDGVEHYDKISFKEIKDAELFEDRRIIVEAIKKKTNIDDLIDELLKPIAPRRLKRLANAIKKNKSVKVQHGCLGAKIGREYVELIPAMGF